MPNKNDSIAVAESFAAPVELGVADAVVAGLAKRLDGAVADTPAGYEVVRKGIAECRTLRVQAKKAHKELKQSALEWGRACDAELRRVTALIETVELPLKQEKARVDDEKERLKREKEEAARLEREAKERAEREKREAEEAAERERIRKEQAAEAARIAEENKKLQAKIEEQKRKHREEEERLAEERRKIDAEREAIEKEKREKAEAERREQMRVEAERRKKEEAKLEAEREAEAKRLRDEPRPDSEKLLQLAEYLDSINMPDVETRWAKHILESVACDLDEICKQITEAVENQSSKTV
jgi:chromosome segregation ATPase